MTEKSIVVLQIDKMILSTVKDVPSYWRMLQRLTKF